MHNIPITLKRSLAAILDFALITAIIWLVISLAGYDLELVLISAWHSNLVGFGLMNLLGAVCIHWWGATPGQALFGLSVRNADGSTLSFGKALLRGLLVFIEGCALGLPFYGIIYIVLGVNLLKLGISGTTFWDDQLHAKVTEKKFKIFNHKQ